jgi:outer membrane lipoprotein-sorting protein
MKTFLVSLGLVWFSTVSLAESPEAILKKADEVRNPAESFQMTVETENQDGESSKFEVKIKGSRKTLVKTLSPARDRGRNLLMIGEDMWAYVPNLKRSVRVALSQKLTGEAANGDISRMRWAGDYDVKLEKQDGKQWVLFLTADKKGLTYDKIRVWISKEGYRPMKAEYLSLSGDVLKNAKFDDYKMMEGAERPGTLIISDAKRKSQKTTITIVDIKKASFPDALFQESTLGN